MGAVGAVEVLLPERGGEALLVEVLGAGLEAGLGVLVGEVGLLAAVAGNGVALVLPRRGSSRAVFACPKAPSP